MDDGGGRAGAGGDRGAHGIHPGGVTAGEFEAVSDDGDTSGAGRGRCQGGKEKQEEKIQQSEGAFHFFITAFGTQRRAKHCRSYFACGFFNEFAAEVKI
jgi:hypothetical protein